VLAEEAPAAAEEDWEDHQAELVEEVVGDESLDELACRRVGPGRLLEPDHLKLSGAVSEPARLARR
jgi:hypothetical protein